MDQLRGFLTDSTIENLVGTVQRGYKTAQDLQNPPLSTQLVREDPDTGAMAPVGEPFQPIRIKFGLREVATYGDQTPVQTARADADMLIWGIDPDTGLSTPESDMQVGDYIEWTAEGREHTARIAALYPIQYGAINVEIELVQ